MIINQADSATKIKINGITAPFTTEAKSMRTIRWTRLSLMCQENDPCGAQFILNVGGKETDLGTANINLGTGEIGVSAKPESGYELVSKGAAEITIVKK